MKKLRSFLLLSLDGYYADPKGDTSWAHGSSPDPEYDAFTTKNAGGGGTLLMGRKTYETMVAYWPTPQAQKDMPEVAKVMNESQKIVFSKTLTKSDWQNVRFVKGELAKEVEKLKREADSDIVILGSGSIVKELAEAGLVDEFQFVVNPILLGAGKKMFEGMKKPRGLELEKSRKFENGIVVSNYAPSAEK
jgi:dihydrofolate reductase